MVKVPDLPILLYSACMEKKMTWFRFVLIMICLSETSYLVEGSDSRHGHHILEAQLTNAVIPGNEAGNRVIYSTNQNDYFVLYGCDSCITDVEQY